MCEVKQKIQAIIEKYTYLIPSGKRYSFKPNLTPMVTEILAVCEEKKPFESNEVTKQ